jgi:hypothetical protein
MDGGTAAQGQPDTGRCRSCYKRSRHKKRQEPSPCDSFPISHRTACSRGALPFHPLTLVRSRVRDLSVSRLVAAPTSENRAVRRDDRAMGPLELGGAWLDHELPIARFDRPDAQNMERQIHRRRGRPAMTHTSGPVPITGLEGLPASSCPASGHGAPISPHYLHGHLRQAALKQRFEGEKEKVG